MTEKTRKYNLVGSIVMYNNDPKMLERAIRSFYFSNLENIKLCLIDNSPSKTIYIDAMLLNYPEVDYIYNKKNIGYGAGNNIAIEKYKSQTKYHLVFNPDVEFSDDVLSKLFYLIENNKDVGLAGVKVLNPEGIIQHANKRLPNPLNIIVRFLGNKIPIFGLLIKKIFKKSRDKYKLKDLDYKKDINCPVVSGCFMLFRNKALEKTGYFDQNFFMYFDDVDLSRRVYKNFKVRVFSKVSVIHRWERSSYRNFKLFVKHINSTVKYFNKWGWFFDSERKKFNNETCNIKDN